MPARLFGSALLLLALPLAAQSVNNNQSCDIAVTPAATLLLPYFEVDVSAAVGVGATTIFTVTNTSRYPQIARATVWTDWAYPVLTFHIFLTGYDVQSINLFDVVVRGIVVPGSPRSGTGIDTPPGSASNTLGVGVPLDNTSNPNFVSDGALGAFVTCVGLPGKLPEDLRAAVMRALSTGLGYGICNNKPIGGNRGGRFAAGYVTIDVVSYCSAHFPAGPEPGYFEGLTAPLLFDNVLLGDYQHLSPTTGFGDAAPHDAIGNPMVHIRAIPEGGLSGASGGDVVPTNLPYTFYDRYTPAKARTADRRQPLPSLWSARYIQGGTGLFITELTIWREGVTSGLPSCTGFFGPTVERNSAIAITDIIRFDEHENSWGLSTGLMGCTCAPTLHTSSAASRMQSSSSLLPPMTSIDLGGWLYLNLSSGSQWGSTAGYVCSQTLSAQRAGFGSCDGTAAALGASGSRTTTQNWVTTSMFGSRTNRLTVELDAAALGNGCTPAAPKRSTIAPATQRGGALVCPDGAANCGAATQPRTVNP